MTIRKSTPASPKVLEQFAVAIAALNEGVVHDAKPTDENEEMAAVKAPGAKSTPIIDEVDHARPAERQKATGAVPQRRGLPPSAIKARAGATMGRFAFDVPPQPKSSSVVLDRLRDELADPQAAEDAFFTLHNSASEPRKASVVDKLAERLGISASAFDGRSLPAAARRHPDFADAFIDAITSTGEYGHEQSTAFSVPLKDRRTGEMLSADIDAWSNAVVAVHSKDPNRLRIRGFDLEIRQSVLWDHPSTPASFFRAGLIIKGSDFIPLLFKVDNRQSGDDGIGPISLAVAEPDRKLSVERKAQLKEALSTHAFLSCEAIARDLGVGASVHWKAQDSVDKAIDQLWLNDRLELLERYLTASNEGARGHITKQELAAARPHKFSTARAFARLRIRQEIHTKPISHFAAFVEQSGIASRFPWPPSSTDPAQAQRAYRECVFGEFTRGSLSGEEMAEALGIPVY